MIPMMQMAGLFEGAGKSKYRYFRLRVDSTCGAQYVYIREMRIKEGEVAYPDVDMTAYNTPSPYVVTASSYFFNDAYIWEPWEAFSSVYIDYGETAWLSAPFSGTEWLQIDMGAEIRPSSLTIQTSSENGLRQPGEFALLASNTGAFTGEEVTLGAWTRTDVDWSNNSQYEEFQL